jgi:hypothetical protein
MCCVPFRAVPCCGVFALQWRRSLALESSLKLSYNNTYAMVKLPVRKYPDVCCDMTCHAVSCPCLQWRKSLALESSLKLLDSIALVAAAPESIDRALADKVIAVLLTAY